ncbi:MAG: hypothetical protein L0Y70_03380 [Gemmataceae bacterium]|nr:hypothetical protein [Gemmataceae bacterium]
MMDIDHLRFEAATGHQKPQFESIMKALLQLFVDIWILLKGLWSILVLVLLACWLGYHYYKEIRANIMEPQPTTFAITEFHSNYQGQYWVRLSGKLALEHRKVENVKGYRKSDIVRIFVPLVDTSWFPDHPVHAVVIFEPIFFSDVDNWAKSHTGDFTATGIVDSYGFRRLFPNLIAGSPIVFVRDGSRPKTFGELLSLAVTLVLSLALFLFVFTWLRKKFLNYMRG